MKPLRVVDVTRLYFGLPVPGGTEWLREPFAAEDPSFSMINNEREVAVLASCLLSAALDDENVSAGLAVLACAAGGHRKPVVKPSLVESARARTLAMSITSRRGGALPPMKLGGFAKSKVPELTAALLAGADWNKAAALTTQISDEAQAGTKLLATQVQGVLPSLIKQVGYIDEQTSLLWWFLGAWSRVLNKPFDELDIPLAATMVGLDAAVLVIEPPGPPAVQALLQRLLTQGGRHLPTDVTIQSAVELFPVVEYSKLEIPTSVQQFPDIAPVLNAFRLSSEVGSPGWHAPFKKASHLKATTKMTPFALAMQVYREMMLSSLVK